MKISQFDYTLPERLIAHMPVNPRDHSRLLAVSRHTCAIKHLHFYQIADLLGPDDTIVLNRTKVFPARIIGRKDTGGKVELLLTENKSNKVWTVMHKGPLRKNQILLFNEVPAHVISTHGMFAEIQFDLDSSEFNHFLALHGKTPLPPYIRSSIKENKIREDYQTIYAREEGSVAAPTAGLHFTHNLFRTLKSKGIAIEYITLHVGPGTFLPVQNENLEDHIIHSERYSIEASTITRLNEAKRKEKRIIAVGTTTCRVLETLASEKGILEANRNQGSTNLFIYPPYKFRFVDALITNFHLPKSTLLALVSTFTSYPNTSIHFSTFKETCIGKAYKEAKKHNYRFYSFGDACFIF